MALDISLARDRLRDLRTSQKATIMPNTIDYVPIFHPVHCPISICEVGRLLFITIDRQVNQWGTARHQVREKMR